MVQVGCETREESMTTFIYKCTNCHTSNKTTSPPEDSMLHCMRCGYLTVQYLHAVKHRQPKRKLDAALSAGEGEKK